MAIEFMIRSDLPVFSIVTIREADPPTATEPRLTDTGLTRIFGVVAAFEKKGNKIIHKPIPQIIIKSLAFTLI